MPQILIGAGGWAYFRVPRMNPLTAYSKAFDFVEVNSTFYELPNLKLVESWRRRVPPSFEFSVRCHKTVTHKYLLELTNETLKIINYMTKICKILNSNLLILETPENLVFTEDKISSIKKFFDAINLEDIRVAWEIRSPITNKIIDLMKDYGIIHSIDFSKSYPAYDSDITYSRLFGKGTHNIYQFTDEELTEIYGKASKQKSKKVYLSFHGVRMYKDAARLKIYEKTGKFPMVTRSTGINSLAEILGEDAKFPSSKKELIEHQGWKIFDLTSEKRIRVAEILSQIPEKKYYSLNDLIETVKNYF